MVMRVFHAKGGGSGYPGGGSTGASGPDDPVPAAGPGSGGRGPTQATDESADGARLAPARWSAAVLLQRSRRRPVRDAGPRRSDAGGLLGAYSAGRLLLQRRDRAGGCAKLPARLHGEHRPGDPPGGQIGPSTIDLRTRDSDTVPPARDPNPPTDTKH